MKEHYLLSIIGPTALGKTRLAIDLAWHFKTEILSADSRQFYREMRIGTAVPGPEELAAIPHHFIQHISVTEKYSVGAFERDALALLNRLFKRHRVVVMVGGSGLYIDAVTKGLDDFPQVSPEIRKKLNERLRTEGIETLQEELKNLDPAYYEEIDRHNPQRLIRGLEIVLGSGKPISYFRKGKATERPFKTLTLGLMADRKTIYRRIEERVDRMMAEGLLEEARSLYDVRHLNALRTVGYKELFAYLEGQYDLETAISEIKKNTRRFAKRQLTWFRKHPDIHWIPYEDPMEHALNYLKEQMDERRK